MQRPSGLLDEQQLGFWEWPRLDGVARNGSTSMEGMKLQPLPQMASTGHDGRGISDHAALHSSAPAACPVPSPGTGTEPMLAPGAGTELQRIADCNQLPALWSNGHQGNGVPCHGFMEVPVVRARRSSLPEPSGVAPGAGAGTPATASSAAAADAPSLSWQQQYPGVQPQVDDEQDMEQLLGQLHGQPHWQPPGATSEAPGTSGWAAQHPQDPSLQLPASFLLCAAVPLEARLFESWQGLHHSSASVPAGASDVNGDRVAWPWEATHGEDQALMGFEQIAAQHQNSPSHQLQELLAATGAEPQLPGGTVMNRASVREQHQRQQQQQQRGYKKHGSILHSAEARAGSQREGAEEQACRQLHELQDLLGTADLLAQRQLACATALIPETSAGQPGSTDFHDLGFLSCLGHAVGNLQLLASPAAAAAMQSDLSLTGSGDSRLAEPSAHNGHGTQSGCHMQTADAGVRGAGQAGRCAGAAVGAALDATPNPESPTFGIPFSKHLTVQAASRPISSAATTVQSAPADAQGLNGDWQHDAAAIPSSGTAEGLAPQHPQAEQEAGVGQTNAGAYSCFEPHCTDSGVGSTRAASFVERSYIGGGWGSETDVRAMQYGMAAQGQQVEQGGDALQLAACDAMPSGGSVGGACSVPSAGQQQLVQPQVQAGISGCEPQQHEEVKQQEMQHLLSRPSPAADQQQQQQQMPLEQEAQQKGQGQEVEPQRSDALEGQGGKEQHQEEAGTNQPELQQQLSAERQLGEPSFVDRAAAAAAPAAASTLLDTLEPPTSDCLPPAKTLEAKLVGSAAAVVKVIEDASLAAICAAYASSSESELSDAQPGGHQGSKETSTAAPGGSNASASALAGEAVGNGSAEVPPSSGESGPPRVWRGNGQLVDELSLTLSKKGEVAPGPRPCTASFHVREKRAERQSRPKQRQDRRREAHIRSADEAAAGAVAPVDGRVCTNRGVSQGRTRPPRGAPTRNGRNDGDVVREAPAHSEPPIKAAAQVPQVAPQPGASRSKGPAAKGAKSQPQPLRGASAPRRKVQWGDDGQSGSEAEDRLPALPASASACAPAPVVVEAPCTLQQPAAKPGTPASFAGEALAHVSLGPAGASLDAGRATITAQAKPDVESRAPQQMVVVSAVKVTQAVTQRALPSPFVQEQSVTGADTDTDDDKPLVIRRKGQPPLVRQQSGCSGGGAALACTAGARGSDADGHGGTACLSAPPALQHAASLPSKPAGAARRVTSLTALSTEVTALPTRAAPACEAASLTQAGSASEAEPANERAPLTQAAPINKAVLGSEAAPVSGAVSASEAAPVRGTASASETAPPTQAALASKAAPPIQAAPSKAASAREAPKVIEVAPCALAPKTGTSIEVAQPAAVPAPSVMAAAPCAPVPFAAAATHSASPTTSAATAATLALPSPSPPARGCSTPPAEHEPSADPPADEPVHEAVLPRDNSRHDAAAAEGLSPQPGTSASLHGEQAVGTPVRAARQRAARRQAQGQRQQQEQELGLRAGSEKGIDEEEDDDENQTLFDLVKKRASKAKEPAALRPVGARGQQDKSTAATSRPRVPDSLKAVGGVGLRGPRSVRAAAARSRAATAAQQEGSGEEQWQEPEAAAVMASPAKGSRSKGKGKASPRQLKTKDASSGATNAAGNMGGKGVRSDEGVTEDRVRLVASAAAEGQEPRPCTSPRRVVARLARAALPLASMQGAGFLEAGELDALFTEFPETTLSAHTGTSGEHEAGNSQIRRQRRTLTAEQGQQQAGPSLVDEGQDRALHPGSSARRGARTPGMRRAAPLRWQRIQGGATAAGPAAGPAAESTGEGTAVAAPSAVEQPAAAEPAAAGAGAGGACSSEVPPDQQAVGPLQPGTMATEEDAQQQSLPPGSARNTDVPTAAPAATNGVVLGTGAAGVAVAASPPAAAEHSPPLAWDEQLRNGCVARADPAVSPAVSSLSHGFETDVECISPSHHLLDKVVDDVYQWGCLEQRGASHTNVDAELPKQQATPDVAPVGQAGGSEGAAAAPAGQTVVVEAAADASNSCPAPTLPSAQAGPCESVPVAAPASPGSHAPHAGPALDPPSLQQSSPAEVPFAPDSDAHPGLDLPVAPSQPPPLPEEELSAALRAPDVQAAAPGAAVQQEDRQQWWKQQQQQQVGSAQSDSVPCAGAATGEAVPATSAPTSSASDACLEGAAMEAGADDQGAPQQPSPQPADAQVAEVGEGAAAAAATDDAPAGVQLQGASADWQPADVQVVVGAEQAIVAETQPAAAGVALESTATAPGCAHVAALASDTAVATVGEQQGAASAALPAASAVALESTIPAEPSTTATVEPAAACASTTPAPPAAVPALVCAAASDANMADDLSGAAAAGAEVPVEEQVAAGVEAVEAVQASFTAAAAQSTCPEVEPGTRLVLEAQPQVEAQVEAQVEVHMDSRADTSDVAAEEAGVGAMSETEAQVVAGAAVESEAGVDLDTAAAAGLEQRAVAEAGVGATASQEGREEVEGRPEAAVSAQAGPEAEAQPETQAGAYARTDAEAEAGGASSGDVVPDLELLLAHSPPAQALAEAPEETGHAAVEPSDAACADMQQQVQGGGTLQPGDGGVLGGGARQLLEQRGEEQHVTGEEVAVAAQTGVAVDSTAPEVLHEVLVAASASLHGSDPLTNAAQMSVAVEVAQESALPVDMADLNLQAGAPPSAAAGPQHHCMPFAGHAAEEAAVQHPTQRVAEGESADACTRGNAAARPLAAASPLAAPDTLAAAAHPGNSCEHVARCTHPSEGLAADAPGTQGAGISDEVADVATAATTSQLGAEGTLTDPAVAQEAAEAVCGAAAVYDIAALLLEPLAAAAGAEAAGPPHRQEAAAAEAQQQAPQASAAVVEAVTQGLANSEVPAAPVQHQISREACGGEARPAVGAAEQAVDSPADAAAASQAIPEGPEGGGHSAAATPKPMKEKNTLKRQAQKLAAEAALHPAAGTTTSPCGRSLRARPPPLPPKPKPQATRRSRVAQRAAPAGAAVEEGGVEVPITVVLGAQEAQGAGWGADAAGRAGEAESALGTGAEAGAEVGAGAGDEVGEASLQLPPDGEDEQWAAEANMSVGGWCRDEQALAGGAQSVQHSRAAKRRRQDADVQTLGEGIEAEGSALPSSEDGVRSGLVEEGAALRQRDEREGQQQSRQDHPEQGCAQQLDAPQLPHHEVRSQLDQVQQQLGHAPRLGYGRQRLPEVVSQQLLQHRHQLLQGLHQAQPRVQQHVQLQAHDWLQEQQHLPLDQQQLPEQQCLQHLSEHQLAGDAAAGPTDKDGEEGLQGLAGLGDATAEALAAAIAASGAGAATAAPLEGHEALLLSTLPSVSDQVDGGPSAGGALPQDRRGRQSPAVTGGHAAATAAPPAEIAAGARPAKARPSTGDSRQRAAAAASSSGAAGAAALQALLQAYGSSSAAVLPQLQHYAGYHPSLFAALGLGWPEAVQQQPAFPDLYGMHGFGWTPAIPGLPGIPQPSGYAVPPGAPDAAPHHPYSQLHWRVQVQASLDAALHISQLEERQRESEAAAEREQFNMARRALQQECQQKDRQCARLGSELDQAKAEVLQLRQQLQQQQRLQQQAAVLPAPPVPQQHPPGQQVVPPLSQQQQPPPQQQGAVPGVSHAGAWQLQQRGPGGPADLTAPINWSRLRREVLRDDVLSDHHLRLHHPGLAVLGEVLYRHYIHSAKVAFNTQGWLQPGRDADKPPMLRLRYPSDDHVRSPAELLSKEWASIKELRDHLDKGNSVLSWMHKRCRKGTESQPVALGLYLKDLHLAEDLRYLHNARQSVADLLATVIPNDLLRYHLPVLGVTSTTPIMYLFGYCGGVGRHVEDAGLQFLNLVLPVPSVYESGLPNTVEWYMDEQGTLEHLLAKARRLAGPRSTMPLHDANHTKTYVPLPPSAKSKAAVAAEKRIIRQSPGVQLTQPASLTEVQAEAGSSSSAPPATLPPQGEQQQAGQEGEEGAQLAWLQAMCHALAQHPAAPVVAEARGRKPARGAAAAAAAGPSPAAQAASAPTLPSALAAAPPAPAAPEGCVTHPSAATAATLETAAAPVNAAAAQGQGTGGLLGTGADQSDGRGTVSGTGGGDAAEGSSAGAEAGDMVVGGALAGQGDPAAAVASGAGPAGTSPQCHPQHPCQGPCQCHPSVAAHTAAMDVELAAAATAGGPGDIPAQPASAAGAEGAAGVIGAAAAAGAAGAGGTPTITPAKRPRPGLNRLVLAGSAAGKTRSAAAAAAAGQDPSSRMPQARSQPQSAKAAAAAPLAGAARSSGGGGGGGGASSSAAAAAPGSAAQPQRLGPDQWSRMYGDIVMGHLGHAVCVAGGWCRISSNYVEPSFFLSRVVSYVMALCREQRTVFFNPPDGSAQDFQDTWVPLNSPDLLLFDCVLRALRASATFPSPDQQQSFVKLLRYIVSRTEAGRERVLADIERAGLGDKRKEVYGAAMPTGTALTETNYFHGFQSHQCEVCADDLTLLRVVVRVPASSGMLRKEQKLESWYCPRCFSEFVNRRHRWLEGVSEVLVGAQTSLQDLKREVSAYMARLGFAGPVTLDAEQMAAIEYLPAVTHRAKQASQPAASAQPAASSQQRGSAQAQQQRQQGQGQGQAQGQLPQQGKKQLSGQGLKQRKGQGSAPASSEQRSRHTPAASQTQQAQQERAGQQAQQPKHRLGTITYLQEATTKVSQQQQQLRRQAEYGEEEEEEGQPAGQEGGQRLPEASDRHRPAQERRRKAVTQPALQDRGREGASASEAALPSGAEPDSRPVPLQEAMSQPKKSYKKRGLEASEGQQGGSRQEEPRTGAGAGGASGKEGGTCSGPGPAAGSCLGSGTEVGAGATTSKVPMNSAQAAGASELAAGAAAGAAALGGTSPGTGVAGCGPPMGRRLTRTVLAASTASGQGSEAASELPLVASSGFSDAPTMGRKSLAGQSEHDASGDGQAAGSEWQGQAQGEVQGREAKRARLAKGGQIGRRNSQADAEEEI